MWQTAGNYWGTQAENTPLLHTWTLSVEEQFYFIYPFLFIFLVRMAGKRMLAGVSLIALGSFLLYLYGLRYHPHATFYLLPTRAWELACGCLLSIQAWQCRPAKAGPVKANTGSGFLPIRSGMALAGLGCIVFACLYCSNESGLTGQLILPVLGTSAVILFGADKAGAVHSVLAFPLLTAIGRMSYSIYLWHWPVLVFARYYRPTDNYNLSYPVLAVIIGCLSLLSYLLVERPLRQSAGIVPIALVLLITSLTLSILLWQSSHQYDTAAYNPVVWEGCQYDTMPDPTSRKDDLALRLRGIVSPGRLPSDRDAYRRGGIIRRYGKATPAVVVLGDSHALMWSGLIDEVCREAGLTVSFYAADATPPFIHFPVREQATAYFSAREKFDFDSTRLACIRKWRPGAVIVVQKWSIFKDMDGARALIDYISDQGSAVILIEQPPELLFGDKNMLFYLAHYGIKPDGGHGRYLPLSDNPDYERGRAAIRKLADEYPGCSYLPVKDIYVNAFGQAWVLDGADVLYIDDDHLSQSGTRKAKARLRRQLLDAPGIKKVD
jgi:hypothetical protein